MTAAGIEFQNSGSPGVRLRPKAATMRIMIFAVAALGAWSVATSVAQAQSSLPPIVREAIEASRKDCTESTVLKAESVTLEAGFVVERDVNGDERKDYILDYGKFGVAKLPEESFAVQQDA